MAGQRDAIIGEGPSATYVDLAERTYRLFGALRQGGVDRGDRVSVLTRNTRLALEAHFGVPAAGAVLNMLNIRLSAQELAWIVRHAGSKVLIVESQLDSIVVELRRLLPEIQMIVSGGDGKYERMIASADPACLLPLDEHDLLSLNYTSGTTGRPKGVMYSHRGAYLQAVAVVAHQGLSAASRWLWTLPMFHCNGWCFPWAVTAAAATHVELARVDPLRIWEHLSGTGVTHFAAAPTALTDLMASGATRNLDHRVSVSTGARRRLRLFCMSSRARGSK